MKVEDIAGTIEQMIPLGLAQDWDNVGLLVGDARRDVRRILLTIDVTQAVVVEAKRRNVELIVSYHPVIWDGLKRVTAGGPGSIVHELILARIAVFSIHTALDAAVGGVNDGLAEIVGIEHGEPIGDYVDDPSPDSYKLVVFAPADALAKVSNAIFAAGAGHIGNYSRCSFQAEGTGTFLPLKGSRPTIGRQGKIETVREVRLESVVQADALQRVIDAMIRAHPYETPAYDVYRLHDNRRRFGLGRIGKLAKPANLDTIMARIKKATGAPAAGIIGKDKRLVKIAAVCAGSCGTIINHVIEAKADLYVTGELKHHHALAAQEAGVTCVCLSHTVSERFMLKKLAKQLRERLAGVDIKISTKDTDPFRWKSL